MKRPLRHLAVAMTGVASLGLALFFAGPSVAGQSATPTSQPEDCGAAITSWGPGTVDDIEVALIRIVLTTNADVATPIASPVALRVATHSVEIAITNHGDSVASVVAHDIALILCDGTILAPLTNQSHQQPIDEPIASGVRQSVSVEFAVPSGATPLRLIVPVARVGSAGGRVEFPLVDTRTISSSEEADGSAGADVVGGDAVGGDGADGEDATAGNGS